MTRITYEFHWVCPNRFLSLWYLDQNVHLSCVKISTISKRTETSFHMTHVTKQLHRVHPTRLLSLWYIRHNLQTDRNKLPLKAHHLGVPSGVSKTISEPMVYLAQTMLLSCSDANTFFKWTETRFHMTHVT
jgi:hypothetical protein